jgi:iron complex outermembrane recepter protein
VRRGYKTGGFNPNANVQIPATFGPEEVTDYEVGVKADFRLGGMPVRTNVAAFYDEYTDIQRSVFRDNPLQPGAILTFIANASSATIKGVEAQVSAKPTENLEIDLNYSYLDATYDEYLFLDASVNRIVDFAGHPLPFSPKHKIGGNIRYHLPVDEEWGELSVYVGANYQGHYKTTDQPQPGWTLGDYTLVNLGATWKNVGQSPVDADLFMTNAFNKKAVAGAQIFYYAIGITARSYIEPRMFGVRLRYQFGG